MTRRNTLTYETAIEEAERIIADVPWSPPAPEPEPEPITPARRPLRPLIQPMIPYQPLILTPPARFIPQNGNGSPCTASRSATLTGRSAIDDLLIPGVAIGFLAFLGFATFAAVGVSWPVAATVFGLIWLRLMTEPMTYYRDHPNRCTGD